MSSMKQWFREVFSRPVVREFVVAFVTWALAVACLMGWLESCSANQRGQ